MKVIPPGSLLEAYTREMFSMTEEREMRDYEEKIFQPQMNVNERRWKKG